VPLAIVNAVGVFITTVCLPWANNNAGRRIINTIILKLNINLIVFAKIDIFYSIG
jgi:hypothetical protein